MGKRTIWGLLGAALLFAVILAGGIWFTLSIGILTILGILEYSQLLKRQNLRPQTEVMLGICLILLALIHITANNHGVIKGESLWICERLMIFMLVVIFLITLFNELIRGNPEQGLSNAAVNLFGTVYIGFMFAYTLMLRSIPGQDGILYIFFAWGVPWINDTAAYFIGLHFGKHKLAPNISPNKSVEGSIGGICGGLLTAILLGIIFHKPLIFMFLLGLLTVIIAQFGDLVESVIKRNAGVKDSGSFLPGHGGLLDRFDSVLLTAPIVYYAVINVSQYF